MRRSQIGLWMMIAALTLLGRVGVINAATPEAPALIEAVKAGDLAVVRDLLPSADLSVTEADGTTALHWAAHRDQVTVADLLIRAGADVNAANRYKMTPLALAAINGSAPMIERLLAAGADAGTGMPSGETMLMLAARAGGVDAVKAFLAHGVDVNARDAVHAQTALMWAAARGNSDVVTLLIANGADVNARTPVAERADPNATNPFPPEATSSGYTWRAIDPSGFSALLYAVRAGRFETVEVLLDGGADVNDKLSNDMSALLVAVANQHFELAAYLLNRGAAPDANEAGWTALHQVVRGRRTATRWEATLEPTGSMSSSSFIQKLLAAGASPNVRMWNDGLRNGARTRFNKMGATPFLLAAKNGDLEAMKLLYEHGADPFTPTADGLTPLMAVAGAATYNPGEDAGSGPEHNPERLEAVQWLVSLGVGVNDADFEGETALHGAVYLGSSEMATYLIEQGAWLDAKNVMGWTPLTVANGAQYTEFFKEQPAVAEVLRQAMVAQGLPIEGHNADPAACHNCITTRGSEAARFFNHGRELAANTALVEELKRAR